MKNLKWWQKGVIYQIYPRSFYSHYNQAMGDLKGITKKMEYLAALGVDGIWLSPFFKSPMKDYGYDVSDYKAIDPMFGNMQDFNEMLKTAHKKKLKVIIDQVYNHTSDQHSWFEESKQSKNNPKADWYVWRNAKKDGGPPNNWLSVFGGPAWTWNTSRSQYYLHQFLKEQPDLNFHHSEVAEAILETVEFWLKKGVDGFRLDTINFYYQDPEFKNNPPLKKRDENNPHSSSFNPYFYQEHLYDRMYKDNIPFLEKLRALSDKYKDKMYMGEIGDYNPIPILESYTQGDTRLHTAYVFILLEQNITPKRIAKFFADTKNKDCWPCIAFSNHDVVRSLSRIDCDTKYEKDAAKMLISLLASLRGTPCLYQGEELGLKEAELKFRDLQDPYGIAMWPNYKGRDGCRTPLPWKAGEKHAGFSTTNPWLPIINSHQKKAVNLQQEDPYSVLQFTKQFLHWRKTQELIHGLAALEVEKATDNCLIFVRKGNKETIRAMFNFSNSSLEIAAKKEVLFASNKKTTNKQGKIVLPAFSSCFVRI